MAAFICHLYSRNWSAFSLTGCAFSTDQSEHLASEWVRQPSALITAFSLVYKRFIISIMSSFFFFFFLPPIRLICIPNELFEISRKKSPPPKKKRKKRNLWKRVDAREDGVVWRRLGSGSAICWPNRATIEKRSAIGRGERAERWWKKQFIIYTMKSHQISAKFKRIWLC